MENTAINYGSYFWGVELRDGEYMMCFADRVEVSEGGYLTFWRNEDEKAGRPSLPLQILAPDQYAKVWAASMNDGRAVHVDWER